MSNDNHLVSIECGPGWKTLIDPIVTRANEIGATITQIKEKFGCLRIYFDPGQADTDKLEDMIDKAELESATTCEMCGKPGVTMTSGHWLKTVCKEHATELGYRRSK
jgi:hypothetical protein